MNGKSIQEWLLEVSNFSPEQLQNVLQSLAVVGVLWVARRILLGFVVRRTEDMKVQYQWKKASTYIAFLIGVLLVARIWIEAAGSLMTYLGLVSAGIAIALRDLFVNLAAWAFILWRRPFEVGDRIQIGNISGDVVDIRIFQFTIMEIGGWVQADQSTGRVIHVPNGRVFSEPVASYTKGFRYIWNEVPVLLTFESNWKEAKAILTQIAEIHSSGLSDNAAEEVRKVAKKFMISYSRLTPIVYTSVQDCGVLLTLRYLCEPRRRRGSLEAIWEDILEAFAQHDDIDFAYPTSRFFNHRLEGKMADLHGNSLPRVPTDSSQP